MSHLYVVIVLMCLLGVGCGKNQAERVGEKIIEKAINNMESEKPQVSKQEIKQFIIEAVGENIKKEDLAKTLSDFAKTLQQNQEETRKINQKLEKHEEKLKVHDKKIEEIEKHFPSKGKDKGDADSSKPKDKEISRKPYPSPEDWAKGAPVEKVVYVSLPRDVSYSQENNYYFNVNDNSLYWQQYYAWQTYWQGYYTWVQYCAMRQYYALQQYYAWCAMNNYPRYVRMPYPMWQRYCTWCGVHGFPRHGWWHHHT